MTEEKKPVRIWVIATDAPAGSDEPVKFELKARTGSAQYIPEKNVLKFPRGRPSYEIRFDLDDRSTYDLRFAKNPKDAIWIDKGGCCPPPAPGDGEGECAIRSVADEGDSLTIENFNREKCTLAFMLQFRSPRSSDLIKFDPIMNNGGGGGNVE